MSFFKKYKSDSIKLIYTPGKVGSSALESAIPRAIHTHTLYCNPPNFPHWLLDYYRPVDKIRFYLKQFVRRRLIKQSKKVTIICVLRDPFKRNISMFFQALPFWLGYSSSHLAGTRLDPRQEGFQYLFDAYNNNFDHGYILEWLDKELKRFTGIDIYQHKPDDTGLYHIQKGKFELVLCRVEDLSVNIDKISKILDVNIENRQANVGQKKWYGEIYQEFQNSYRSPKPIKQLICQSKYYKTFYDK